ncbi:hypothetical protein Tco_0721502, partial [Tanacetum coccineum]
AEKLVETSRGRELVRVNLGYRVVVGGGPNTWPAVVQVGPWIGPELDDPGSKGSSIMGCSVVGLSEGRSGSGLFVGLDEPGKNQGVSMMLLGMYCD